MKYPDYRPNRWYADMYLYGAIMPMPWFMNYTNIYNPISLHNSIKQKPSSLVLINIVLGISFNGNGGYLLMITKHSIFYHWNSLKQLPWWRVLIRWSVIPLMLLTKGSLTTVTITKATIDAEGITLSYNAHALIPELFSTHEIIACALLKDDELLTAGQFIGIGTNVTLKLKYPDLQSEQVACCYVFVRSGDGGKVSNSVWVELTN